MQFLTPEQIKAGGTEAGLFKFVRLSTGEYRFFDHRWKHREAVQPGETGVAAGTYGYDVWRNPPCITVVDSYSRTLGVGAASQDEEYIAKVFGLPVVGKWEV